MPEHVWGKIIRLKYVLLPVTIIIQHATARRAPSLWIFPTWRSHLKPPLQIVVKDVRIRVEYLRRAVIRISWAFLQGLSRSQFQGV